MTSNEPKNPSRRRFLKGLFFGGLAALVFPYGLDYGFRLNAPRVYLDLENLRIEPVWPDIYTALYIKLCIKGTDHCWLSLDGIDTSVWKPYVGERELGVITNAIIGGYIKNKEQLDDLVNKFYERVAASFARARVPKFLADNYMNFIRKFTHDGHYIDWEVYAEEHKKAEIPLASIVLARALEIIRKDKAEWGKYHLPSLLVLYFLAREGNFPAIIKEAIKNRLVRPEYISWYIQDFLFERLVGVSPEELKAIMLGEIHKERLEDFNLKSKRSKDVFTLYLPHPFTYLHPPDKYTTYILIRDFIFAYLKLIIHDSIGIYPEPLDDAYTYIILQRLGRNVAKALPLLHHVLNMYANSSEVGIGEYYLESHLLTRVNWKEEAKRIKNHLFSVINGIGIPSPFDIYRYMLSKNEYIPYAQNVIKLSLARGWLKAIEATEELYKEEIDSLSRFQENSWRFYITESIKYGSFRFPFDSLEELEIGYKIGSMKGDFTEYFHTMYRDLPIILTYAYAIAKLALKDQP